MSNPATLKNSLSGATARHKRSHIADLTAYFTLFPQRGRRVVMPIKHVWGGGETMAIVHLFQFSLVPLSSPSERQSGGGGRLAFLPEENHAGCV